jgi:hypothetical protein
MKSRFKFGTLSDEQIAKIKVTLLLEELNALIDRADQALDGNSNDDEHDALYLIREKLAGMSTDPERRYKDSRVWAGRVLRGKR